jgi:hypothetical protein
LRLHFNDEVCGGRNKRELAHLGLVADFFGAVTMVRRLEANVAILVTKSNTCTSEQGRRSLADKAISHIYHDRGLAPIREGRGLSGALQQQALLKQLLATNADVRTDTPIGAHVADNHLLLLENIHDKTVEVFQKAGFSRISRLKMALTGPALHQQLKAISVLGIRSRTQLDAEAIAAADRLTAIGCFGVGTNQVDLDAARLRGIPVFNAPFANTRSVAELVIGEIIMLFRQIFPRSVAAHSGCW